VFWVQTDFGAVFNEVVGWNGLGEDIGRIVRRLNPDELGLTELDAFTNGVVVDVDVLHLAVRFFSLGHLECRLRVAVDLDGVVEGKTNLFVKLENPGCLLRSIEECDVLCLPLGAKGNLPTLGTNTYLLIRYMSSKLQTNGKKTSPVITLQMLGFFRIY